MSFNRSHYDREFCLLLCMPQQRLDILFTLLNFALKLIKYARNLWPLALDGRRICNWGSKFSEVPTSKPPRVKSTKHRVWIYQQADFDLANDKLAELSIDETQPVDSVWTDWSAHFMSTMTEAIPSKLVKQSNNLPYFTSDLCKLIRMKNVHVLQQLI